MAVRLVRELQAMIQANKLRQWTSTRALVIAALCFISLEGAASAAAAADLIASAFNFNFTANQTACLVNAIGRGMGLPLRSCPNGTERNGLLCYASCHLGYSGDGPVCWRSCPDGMVDFGTFCHKSYGKGCCCTVFGCCGGCHEGYSDAGCFCRKTELKHSYGRGAGLPLTCGSRQEENGGLCYHACPEGYDGEGPVCWERAAPKGFPHRCNGVLWASDHAVCEAINMNLLKLGGFTAACIGSAMAVVVTGAAMLWPAAQFFCGNSYDSLLDEVRKMVELTQVKTCL